MGLSRYGYTGKKKRTIFRLSPDCSCGDYWADMLTAGVILCTVMNVVVIVSVSYIWYLNMERLDIIQLENEILRRRIELLNISELIDKETKEKDKHIKEIKRLRRSADFLLQYPLQQNQTQFGELSASISKTQQEIGELKKELKSSIKLIRDMATVPNSSACSYPYRLNPHSRTCVRFVRSSPLVRCSTPLSAGQRTSGHYQLCELCYLVQTTTSHRRMVRRFLDWWKKIIWR